MAKFYVKVESSVEQFWCSRNYEKTEQNIKWIMDGVEKVLSGKSAGLEMEGDESIVIIPSEVLKQSVIHIVNL